ncbi:hypothetical protein [Seleniivibrio sp.]|uniref:hypothetical protein n=1 Tax=Seleniivibrio sp. TaxID=2898801 RepID=UPI0025F06E01|nr:hypothetical protein [Seleniivibrio sp.]MCD8554086.1 hypothetical protein [Seleniivibrio sp.]
MKTKIFIVILTLLSFSTAFAHKLNILAFAENNVLTVNSYFADGTPCRECAFQVFDAEGKVFAEGKLSNDGEFSRNGKLPAEMKIVVDGGMGHRGEQTITSSAETETVNEEPVQSTSVDTAQIRQLIREELSKQTAELKAEIDKGRSHLDMIIAGIGYILGIFGIAMIVKKK